MYKTNKILVICLSIWSINSLVGFGGWDGVELFKLIHKAPASPATAVFTTPHISFQPHEKAVTLIKNIARAIEAKGFTSCDDYLNRESRGISYLDLNVKNNPEDLPRGIQDYFYSLLKWVGRFRDIEESLLLYGEHLLKLVEQEYAQSGNTKASVNLVVEEFKKLSKKQQQALLRFYTMRRFFPKAYEENINASEYAIFHIALTDARIDNKTEFYGDTLFGDVRITVLGCLYLFNLILDENVSQDFLNEFYATSLFRSAVQFEALKSKA